MVDSSGLENRYSLKQRTIEGSNPSLSFFCSANRFVFFIGFIRLSIIKENGSARGDSRARTEKKRLDRNELKMKRKESFY